MPTTVHHPAQESCVQEIVDYLRAYIESKHSTNRVPRLSGTFVHAQISMQVSAKGTTKFRAIELPNDAPS